MNDYSVMRIVKLAGYTVMAGSLGLALTFMAMIY
jgi:hypothetical protein